MVVLQRRFSAVATVPVPAAEPTVIIKGGYRAHRVRLLVVLRLMGPRESVRAGGWQRLRTGPIQTSSSSGAAAASKLARRGMPCCRTAKVPFLAERRPWHTVLRR